MEPNANDIDVRNQEFEKGRSWAMGAAMLVYIGVVLAATVLFISFVLLALPANAYLSRVVMSLAGLLIGGSMIAFPLALHLWAVDKWHRRVTTALYYLEMCFIAVNSIVAFTSLLAKYAGATAPEWVILYEPFSIVAIIYTLAAWGTVFLLDPAHKRKSKDQENWQRFHDKISARVAEFLDSQEGEDVIMDIATRRAYEEFNANRFKTGRRSWGTGKGKSLSQNDSQVVSQSPQTKTVNIPEDVYKQLLQDSNVTFPVDRDNHKDPTYPPRN